MVSLNNDDFFFKKKIQSLISEAELQSLESAVKLAIYGVDLHNA